MSTATPKVLLIDDDVTFGKLVSTVAESRGLKLDHFTSLMDMGSFARIKDYDLALLDYYLDSLNGDEIAEYVDTFFRDSPVVIVSSKTFNDEQQQQWPSCVRRFVHKSEGAERIIDAALETLDRDRLLKRLSSSENRPLPYPTA